MCDLMEPHCTHSTQRSARCSDSQKRSSASCAAVLCGPSALRCAVLCRLLVQVMSAEGWRSRKTLARGILPLQPVVAAYRSSYKAVPVKVQLESSSAAVGSLVFSAQLISSASVRAGMHEAIRRMRRMAAESREDAGGVGHSDAQGPASTQPSQ